MLAHRATPVRRSLRSLPVGYDWYVAPWGRDGSAGTASAPWKTLTKLVAAMDATGSGVSRRGYVGSGVYTDSGLYSSGLLGTVTLQFAPRVVVDTRNLTASAVHGIGNGGSGTFTANLWGTQFHGNNTNSANGYSVNNGTATVIDPTGKFDRYANVFRGGSLFSGYDDGWSSHGTGNSTAQGLWFRNCTKSAFAHVNSSTISGSHCLMEALAGATLGVGVIQNTGPTAFDYCGFWPATHGQAVDFLAATLTKCVVGTPSLGVALSASTSLVCSLTDCYMHAGFDARLPLNLLRCYGRLSMRVRGAPATTDMTMRGCAWVDSYASYSLGDILIAGNFEDGSGNWDGIGYDWQNNVFRGYATVIGSGFSANQQTKWNANSVTNYNGFFGNTTNYGTGVTPGTNLVTTDPGMGNFAGSTDQREYAVTNTDHQGTGLGGGNIGFRAGDFTE